MSRLQPSLISEHKAWSNLTLIGSVVITTLVGALIVPKIPWNSVVLMSLALFGVICAPLIGQAVRGTLDTISPVVIFACSWTAMFVLRALENVRNADMTLRGRYETGDYYIPALGLAALGAVGFYVGYFLPFRAPAVRDFSRRPTLLVGTRAFFLSALLVLIPSLAVMLLGSGGATTSYIHYLPLATLGSGTILIAIGIQRNYRRWAMLGVGVIILFFVHALFVGQRFYILLAFSSIAVFGITYLRRRLSFLGLLASVVVLIFLLMGPILAWRSHEARNLPFTERISYAAASAPDALNTVVAGPTNEMLPALALQIKTQGEFWEFSPGYLPIQILGHWIPRSLWPEKNMSIPEMLYSRYFPDYYEVSRNSAQFSVLGELYYDSGIIGVTLGMFVIGMLARIVWNKLVRHGDDVIMHAFYATVPIILIYALRGDLAINASYALFIYLAFIVAGLALWLTPRAA